MYILSMFEYQKYKKYFAQIAGGMEDIGEEELIELGAEDTKCSYRGVYFHADAATLYRVNYCSRLITRVLAPLLTFDCHSTKYLTKTAMNIPWDQLLTLEKTFAITSSVGNSAIKHSLYASQCLKDGIADYFNEKYGRRPNVNVDDPDVRLNLHIHDNKAVVSFDTSGLALHKRGYRKHAVLAPMQETLAAALIRLSGWNGETMLWDPMCGSGTILCEALMHYCHIPAQYLRKRFGFWGLPDYDAKIWESVKMTADKAVRHLPEGLIRGSDKFAKTVGVADENLRQLPQSAGVELFTRPLTDNTSYENGCIITNPPYGVRLGTKESAMALYKELGDFLKKRCNGTTAYIYVGDPTIKKSIGLKPSGSYPLVNGSLKGELLRIESFRMKFRNDNKPVKSTAIL